jgi:hypothetical protein
LPFLAFVAFLGDGGGEEDDEGDGGYTAKNSRAGTSLKAVEPSPSSASAVN